MPQSNTGAMGLGGGNAWDNNAGAGGFGAGGMGGANGMNQQNQFMTGM